MYKQTVPLFLMIVFLAACISARTTKWGDFPIMHGAKQVPENRANIDYHYTVETDLKSVEKFYRVEMKDSEWDLLGVADMSNSRIPGYSMWYAKGNQTVQIDIWLEGNITHVALLSTE